MSFSIFNALKSESGPLLPITEQDAREIQQRLNNSSKGSATYHLSFYGRVLVIGGIVAIFGFGFSRIGGTTLQEGPNLDNENGSQTMDTSFLQMIIRQNTMTKRAFLKNNRQCRPEPLPEGVLKVRYWDLESCEFDPKGMIQNSDLKGYTVCPSQWAEILRVITKRNAWSSGTFILSTDFLCVGSDIDGLLRLQRADVRENREVLEEVNNGPFNKEGMTNQAEKLAEEDPDHYRKVQAGVRKVQAEEHAAYQRECNVRAEENAKKEMDAAEKKQIEDLINAYLPTFNICAGGDTSAEMQRDGLLSLIPDEDLVGICAVEGAYRRFKTQPYKRPANICTQSPIQHANNTPPRMPAFGMAPPQPGFSTMQSRHCQRVPVSPFGLQRRIR